MAKLLINICLALLFINAKVALAGFCPPDPAEAFKSNNTIFLGFVESTSEDTATLKVLKVYKGVIREPQIKIRYQVATGSNCGVLLTAGSTETIATNHHFWITEDVQTYFSFGWAIKSFRDNAGTELLTSYTADIDRLNFELQKNPTDVNARLKLLSRQEEAKDYYQAVDSLVELQKLVPTNVAYKAQMAFWELWIGRIEKARTTINELLKTHADNQMVKRAYYQMLIFDNKGYKTKADLSNFSDMWIRDIDYSNSNMMDAVFERSDVEEAIFDRIVLKNARFRSSSVGASYKGADLFRVSFQDSRVEGDFTDAKFEEVIFKKTDLSRSKFINAEIANINFADTNLNHVNFTKADIRGADFSMASLENAVFTDVKCDARTKWPHSFKQKVECQG